MEGGDAKLPFAGLVENDGVRGEEKVEDTIDEGLVDCDEH